MSRKLLVLAICLSMVFTMSVPAFAANTESNATQAPMYLSIGDSLAAGCRVPTWVSTSEDQQKAYFAYRRMKADENKFDTYVSPVDGKEHNHWYIHAVPHSYTSKFATAIGASEDSMNGSHPGLRAKDICYILGLADKSAYKGDMFYGEAAEGFELGSLKNSADGYKQAIQTADVISIQLGENEFNTFWEAVSDKLMDTIGGLMASGDSQEKAATADLVAAIRTLVDSLVKQVNDTRSYWNKMMNYINQNKKDGAIVIVAGIPNPFAGIEDNPAMLNNFIPEGTLSEDMLGTVAKLIVKLLDPVVCDINNFYRSKAGKYNYTYTSIPDVKMVSTVTGEYAPYDDIYLDTEVVYFIHTNCSGSDVILESLKKAYKSEMAKKGITVKFNETTTPIDLCKHSNSEIRNVAEASYLVEGYTGDKICTDCGAYFYKGKTVPKLAVTATSLKKLTKGTKSFKATWKTLTNVDGYQLQYSTSSTFSKNSKKATVSGAKNACKTVKSLKSGKKYYVRVRTYVTAEDKNGNGAKAYSAWSKVKTVVVK